VTLRLPLGSGGALKHGWDSLLSHPDSRPTDGVHLIPSVSSYPHSLDTPGQVCPPACTASGVVQVDGCCKMEECDRTHAPSPRYPSKALAVWDGIGQKEDAVSRNATKSNAPLVSGVSEMREDRRRPCAMSGSKRRWQRKDARYAAAERGLICYQGWRRFVLSVTDPHRPPLQDF
jgi:hypothetical protein